MSKYHFSFLLLLCLWTACKSNKTPISATEATTTENKTVAVEESLSQDSVQVGTLPQKKPTYKAEATLAFQLKHTKLHITPVWENQSLKGVAFLKLSPWFYPQNEIIFDAKGLEVSAVKRIDPITKAEMTLSFHQKEKFKLHIALDKTFKRGDEINLQITYNAFPNALTDYEKGYLMTETGVNFINPLNKIKNKPQQIWTQGETAYSSCWFPTFDNPNVKTSQELLITVDSKFQTLSNGKMIETTLHKDGTRTDHWKQEKPHAPYLFMFAVGNFSIVRDKWEDKPIEFWIEKRYENHAEAIFGNTKEMMTYFSTLLGVKYPWDKYSQIIVRDYTSGAMENTSASLFMEGLMVDSVAIKDKHWDDIIAHELFHQWFGDLVTAESWANLPLNEAFANYSEYLWREHKFGKSSAEAHRLEEWAQYFEESKKKQEPLIRFAHESADDMFDSHSYAKGGLILHYLRKTIGDEAFFKGLNLYLTRYAYGKAEVHQLRICFEEVTGRDMNWFFDQWFLKAGHPVLQFQTHFEKGKLTIFANQKNSLQEARNYELPIDIEFWHKGLSFRQSFTLKNDFDTLAINMENAPDLIIIDPERVIPAEILFEKPLENHLLQAQISKDYRAIVEALDNLIGNIKDERVMTNYLQMLRNPSEDVRTYLLNQLSDESLALSNVCIEPLKNVLMQDKNALCRTLALNTLGSKFENQKEVIYSALKNDSSYYVRSNALFILFLLGENNLESLLKQYEHYDDRYMLYVIMEIYSRNGTADKTNWFIEKMSHKSGEELIQYMNPFTNYLLTLSDEEMKKGINYLENLALYDNNYKVRQYVYQMLVVIGGNPENKENVDITKDVRAKIRAQERDFRVRDYMKTFE